MDRDKINKHAAMATDLVNGICDSLTSTDILIYRGIDKSNVRERLGAWWTSDPFYALRYSSGGKGELYHAKVTPQQLKSMAHDVSFEAETKTFTFPKADPPGAQRATSEQISALKSHQVVTRMPIGGDIVKNPANPAEVGREIFGQRVIPPAMIPLVRISQEPGTEFHRTDKDMSAPTEHVTKILPTPDEGHKE